MLHGLAWTLQGLFLRQEQKDCYETSINASILQTVVNGDEEIDRELDKWQGQVDKFECQAFIDRIVHERCTWV